MIFLCVASSGRYMGEDLFHFDNHYVGAYPTWCADHPADIWDRTVDRTVAACSFANPQSSKPWHCCTAAGIPQLYGELLFAARFEYGEVLSSALPPVVCRAT